MKVLVTGAAGFLGKALVKNLLSHGFSVRALVRKEADLAPLSSIGAQPVLGDLTDKDSLQQAVEGIEQVFHIAALFRQADLPTSEYRRVNVEGTRSLLDCAIQAGVKNFLHCSTVGVLGHVDNPPADELSHYNPGDPYQDSKTEGERLFLQYVKENKIRGAVIRPAMVYGPHDTRTLKLFKRIAERRFFYIGSGTSLVHFVDVRDVAEAFRLASQRPQVNGEIFIIAGKTSLTLREMSNIIAALMGVPEPWLHLPVKPMQWLGSLCEAICIPLHIDPPIFRRRVDFFTKDRCFDCRKAANLLGYKPAQSLVEELTDIINSYLQQGAIDRRKISKPSAILRTFAGHIYTWDQEANSIYGWNREQAVGNISHSLLSTKFPNDLAAINSDLVRKGSWHGTLIHKDKTGRELRVNSKWKLLRLPEAHDPLVLELNQPQTPANKTQNWEVFGHSIAGWSSAIGTSL